MAGKVYETLIRLHAKLGPGFKAATGGAAGAMKRLNEESKKLGEQKAGAFQMAKLRREVVALEEKSKAAGDEFRRLKLEEFAVGKASAQLKAQIAAAARAAGQAEIALNSKRAALVKLDTALKVAGVDTSKLTAEQARLAVALGRSERKAAALASLGRKKVALFGASKEKQPLLPKMREQVGSIASDAAKLGTAFTGAMGIAGAGATVAITKFAEFQKGMAEVSTLVTKSPAEMAELTDGVRKLAREYGADHVASAKALYSTISSGVEDTGAAMQVLTVANKLAVGGATEVDIAVTGLTSSVNAYAAAGLTAAEASDAFFVASAIGQASPEALATSIGQIAPTAVAAGVSFNDLLASIGAITTVIPSTSEATSGLRGVLTAVLDPSKEARDEAKRLGIQFNATALKTMGLKKFIEQLAKAKGFGAESAAKLFGRVEAGNAVMVLAGNNMATLNGAVEKMGQKAGATDKAFAKMEQSLDHQAKVARAKANDIAISIGEKLAPIAVKALTKISKWVDDNRENIERWATQGALFIETKLIPGVQKFATEIWPVIRGLGEMILKIKNAVGGWGNFAIAIGALRLVPLGASMAKLGLEMAKTTRDMVKFIAETWRAVAAKKALAAADNAPGGKAGKFGKVGRGLVGAGSGALAGALVGDDAESQIGGGIAGAIAGGLTMFLTKNAKASAIVGAAVGAAGAWTIDKVGSLGGAKGVELTDEVLERTAVDPAGQVSPMAMGGSYEDNSRTEINIAVPAGTPTDQQAALQRMVDEAWEKREAQRRRVDYR